ncbi:LLM class flavin-dependent oxidoreductase [uncultured Phenylobacterium sp.]|uniref:LLM class flavin-dependent oxidoreductase n=1 Tax=uncultured Phenylobacterium sp. TaxID=349273 RepID=UPI0025FB5561|nr:LLM class flavin-dependent oxidoreductase [uncultured Phenylobacterium sp.]
MAYRPKRLKFGAFVAPFHRVGENPTLAMKRDMRLIELLDELGYEEAWIGEHHSFGRELIADPVVFMAAAAVKTKRIKLGTGVLSLPYHHPLMVADRMVQVDHMTEGRAMLGVGPGALTSDAHMMGIPTVEQRGRMADALDAIMRLLRGDELVTMKTDWFELRDARLQLNSFTDPHLPVSVATAFTPSGPTLAGKHGAGLLSVAGVDNKAFERTWGWAEEAAEEAGQKISREHWKVVVPIHVAETRKQALAEIEEGYKLRAYSGDAGSAAAAGGGLFGTAGTLEEQAEKGVMLIGSPDQVAESIEQIIERSGGIGGILSLAHEWANTDATNRSYEMLARYVAPRFQNQLGAVVASRDWVEGNMRTVFGATPAAMERAFTDAGKPLPPALAEAQAKRLAREAEKQAAKQTEGS